MVQQVTAKKQWIVKGVWMALVFQEWQNFTGIWWEVRMTFQECNPKNFDRIREVVLKDFQRTIQDIVSVIWNSTGNCHVWFENRSLFCRVYDQDSDLWTESALCQSLLRSLSLGLEWPNLPAAKWGSLSLVVLRSSLGTKLGSLVMTKRPNNVFTVEEPIFSRPK